MNAEKLSIKYNVEKGELESALNNIRNKHTLLFTMSGKMGSGKDTIGDLISEQLSYLGYELINTSFGHLIREEAQEISDEYSKCEDQYEYARKLNVDKRDLDKLSSLLKNTTVYERTDEARSALQFWGTGIRRKQDESYWINKMAKFIVDSVNKGLSVNITDTRFPNEVQLVEDLLGKTIRLDVPEEIRIKRIQRRDNIKINLKNFMHISETALDDYDFKRVFNGNKAPYKLCEEGVDYIINDRL